VTAPLVLRPLIDLRALASTVKAHALRIAVAAALGAALGVAAFTALPTTYATTTATLLKRLPEDNVNPASAIATELQLSRSVIVAEDIAERLGITEEPKATLRSYEAVAASDDVIRFVVRDESAEAAIARAEAVTDAFFAFRADLISGRVDTAVAAVEEQIAQLSARSDVVQEQIDAIIAVGDSTELDSARVRQLADLTDQRSQIAQSILDLEQTITLTRAQEQNVLQGSSVIEAPQQPDNPLPVKFVLLVGLFTMLGLAAGLGPIVVKELLSNRVRRRDDIVGAGGIDVVAAFAMDRRASSRPTRRRIDALLARGGPTVSDTATAIAAMVPITVTRGSGYSVVLVSVESRAATVATAAMTAKRLADHGRTVVVIDRDGDVFDLPGLLEGEVDLIEGVRSIESGYTTVSGRMADLRVRQVLAAADVVISLIELDPTRPGPLGLPSDLVLLVATAAATDLASVATAAAWTRASGAPLRGAVLAGLDSKDRTAGLTERGVVPTSIEDALPDWVRT
jgi:capsular polysaccharide biosynthesis protein